MASKHLEIHIREKKAHDLLGNIYRINDYEFLN